MALFQHAVPPASTGTRPPGVQVPCLEMRPDAGRSRHPESAAHEERHGRSPVEPRTPWEDRARPLRPAHDRTAGGSVPPAVLRRADIDPPRVHPRGPGWRDAALRFSDGSTPRRGDGRALDAGGVDRLRRHGPPPPPRPPPGRPLPSRRTTVRRSPCGRRAGWRPPAGPFRGPTTPPRSSVTRTGPTKICLCASVAPWSKYQDAPETSWAPVALIRVSTGPPAHGGGCPRWMMVLGESADRENEGAASCGWHP